MTYLSLLACLSLAWLLLAMLLQAARCMLCSNLLGCLFFFSKTCLWDACCHVLQAAAVRAVQQGHDIGSHAAQHLDLTKLQPDQIDQQIAWGVGNISSLTDGSTVPVSHASTGSASFYNHNCVLWWISTSLCNVDSVCCASISKASTSDECTLVNRICCEVQVRVL